MELNNLYTHFSPLQLIQKKNGTDFKTSIARTSSGNRLVELKDESATQAIMGGIKADISALGQATKNAEVGMAFLNTADGGISQAFDSLVRMKELAVSVVQGNLSEQERKMANEEYQVLISQLDNIAERTRFNGKSLLGGGNSRFMEVPYLMEVSGDNLIQNTTQTMLDYYHNSNGVPEAGDYTLTKVGNTYTLENTKIDYRDVSSSTGASIVFNNGIVVAPDSAFVGDGTMTLRVDYKDIYAIKSQLIEVASTDALGTTTTQEITAEDMAASLASNKIGMNFAFLDLQGTLTSGQQDYLPYFVPQGNILVTNDGTDITVTHSSSPVEAHYPFKDLLFVEDVPIGTLGTSSFAALKTDKIIYEFQVGENLNDYQNVELTDVSAVALGLKATAITTSELGQAVQTQIETALTMIGKIQAELGSQQKALGEIISRLGGTTSSFDNTLKYYGGADLPEEIAKVAESMALSQASLIGEAKLNERLSQSWRMLVT